MTVDPFATVIAKLVRCKIALRATGPSRTLEQNEHLICNTALPAIVDAIALLGAFQVELVSDNDNAETLQ